MSTQRAAHTMNLLLLALLVAGVKCSDSAPDILPHLCHNVKCPPVSEITCPADSSVREMLISNDVQQITEAPIIGDETPYNNTEIDDEIYAECCLAKKCMCKTCYIPDCHGENEVVVELQPETMNLPGHCCGEYTCQAKPNCTANGDNQLYWLKSCQRCHCFSGKPMCIQVCDEAVNKTKAICKPEKLNVFFEHGESWRVGCYECECVDGVEKCVLPFCSNINCPQERQVTLKDGCCPICWPDCAPMPGALLSSRAGADKYGSVVRQYDEDVVLEEPDNINASHGSDYSAENEIEKLPDINFNEEEEEAVENPTIGVTAEAQTTKKALERSPAFNSTTTPSSTVASSTINPAGHSTSTHALAEYSPILPTTAAPQAAAALTSEPIIATACPPATAASRNEAPASFQLYPGDNLPEVQVVSESCKHWMVYIIIGILVAFIGVLIAWIIQLRLKQRSYRPVSHIDDNFNKMSCNIKATNAYV